MPQVYEQDNFHSENVDTFLPGKKKRVTYGDRHSSPSHSFLVDV